jgi:hypothetical protein
MPGAFRRIDNFLSATPRRIAIASFLAIIVLFIIIDWADGMRPLCGWDEVFVEIPWCQKPTPAERRLLRRAALREERDDPIEQAIVWFLDWLHPEPRLWPDVPRARD